MRKSLPKIFLSVVFAFACAIFVAPSPLGAAGTGPEAEDLVRKAVQYVKRPPA